MKSIWSCLTRLVAVVTEFSSAVISPSPVSASRPEFCRCSSHFFGDGSLSAPFFSHESGIFIRNWDHRRQASHRILFNDGDKGPDHLPARSQSPSLYSSIGGCPESGKTRAKTLPPISPPVHAIEPCLHQPRIACAWAAQKR